MGVRRRKGSWHMSLLIKSQTLKKREPVGLASKGPSFFFTLLVAYIWPTLSAEFRLSRHDHWIPCVWVGKREREREGESGSIWLSIPSAPAINLQCLHLKSPITRCTTSFLHPLSSQMLEPARSTRPIISPLSMWTYHWSFVLSPSWSAGYTRINAQNNIVFEKMVPFICKSWSELDLLLDLKAQIGCLFLFVHTDFVPMCRGECWRDLPTSRKSLQTEVRVELEYDCSPKFLFFCFVSMMW